MRLWKGNIENASDYRSYQYPQTVTVACHRTNGVSWAGTLPISFCFLQLTALKMHIVDFIIGSLCLSRFAYSAKSKPIWVEPFWPLGHVPREPETLRCPSAGLGEVRHYGLVHLLQQTSKQGSFCGIPSAAVFTFLRPDVPLCVIFLL